MPPKTTASKHPAVPLTKLSDMVAEVDLTDINRTHPVFALLQKSFREAALFNEEAKELIQEELKVKPPATPKKKREKLNRVVDEINQFVAPLALDFDELDDGQELSSPIIPSTPPVRPHEGTQKQLFSTSRPSPSKHTFKKAAPLSAPQRIGHELPKKRAPAVVKLLAPPPTRIPKPAPKNVKSVEQKSNDEESHMTAEKRKKQALHEKAERVRIEREEKEAKVRERQRQIEEEKKRVADGFRSHYARLKEFEEINKTPCSPKTPVREAAKDVITPRRVLVPAKKGRDIIVKQEAINVASPQLKRKTAAKRQQTVEALKPTLGFNSKPKPSAPMLKNAAPEVVKEDKELHYEEVSPEEAFYYSNAFQSDKLGSFEHHEADIQHDMAQPGQSEDLFAQPSATECPSKDLFTQTPLRNDDVFASTPVVILSQPSSEVYDLASQQSVKIHNTIDLEEENETANNYEMTAEKVYLPSTAENYNLEDLSSNDETDDESKPRKDVPKWARYANLRPTVIEMEAKYTIDKRAALFGVIQQPSISLLFNGYHTTRNRHSSQVWKSPFSEPTPGFSRLPR